MLSNCGDGDHSSSGSSNSSSNRRFNNGKLNNSTAGTCTRVYIRDTFIHGSGRSGASTAAASVAPCPPPPPPPAAKRQRPSRGRNGMEIEEWFDINDVKLHDAVDLTGDK
ncbi:hypothetical protein DL765_004186 [Monosporascus sp. GIB2]|nr:hypothetical protein DL765_004186 [Monosporascus sp. GIB2]